MIRLVGRASGAWWWVVIHHHAPELITAADRLDQRRNNRWPDPQPSDTLACFQPAAFRYQIDPDGRETPLRGTGYVGVMRLSAAHLTTEIVAHECVHLGLRIYRAWHDEQAAIGPDCGPVEERLAYVIGECTAAVTDLLHTAGVWA